MGYTNSSEIGLIRRIDNKSVSEKMDMKNDDKVMDALNKYIKNVNNIKTKVDRAEFFTKLTSNGAKKLVNFTQKNLRRSTNISNFINQNLSTGTGRLMENIINFTGDVTKRDLSRYGSRANQLSKSAIKKMFLGKMSKKQVSKLNLTKNMLDDSLFTNLKANAKKLGGRLKKVKSGIDKGFEFNLDDVVGKSKSMISGAMKRVTNPKTVGVMKKIGNSKISGVLKKATKSKFGQNLMKSFSIGNAMNLHSVMTEESNFKKLLAGADIAGDFVSKLPGPVAKAVGLATSTANFVGSMGYDFLRSDFMKRFKGDKIADGLDKAAGFIVEPIGKAFKAVGKFRNKMTKGIKTAKNKFVNGFKDKANLIKEKIPEPVKKAIKGYTDMYMHPVKTIKKAGSLILNKSKSMFKKTNPNDFIELYNKKFPAPGAKQSSIKHYGDLVDTKIQGSQVDNSNKNYFTINISSVNKSSEEVINEFVPKLKYALSNI